MPSRVLPEDATIATVLEMGTLSNPDRYLTGVLKNLMACQREHRSADVRIGRTGGGRAPHYRIEPEGGSFASNEREIMGIDDPETVAREAEHRWLACFNAYNGRNHEKLDWGEAELQSNSWSSRAMSIEEVRNLIGGVRGIKRKAL